MIAGCVKEMLNQMPISTPVNKNTLKHHWDYYKWKYLILAVIIVAGWSLIYTMTRPQAPDSSRINVYVQSDTTSDQLMHDFLDPVWKENVPEEEELNLMTILANDEYTALQQLFTIVYANEGDIYLLKAPYFMQYAAQGAFVPLEGLIEEGKLNADGIDLRTGYADYALEKDKDGYPTKTESHLYGIPLRELYGFVSGMQVDNQDLYACIAVDNGNMDDVITFFDAMIQAGRGEKPDWMQ